MPTWQAYDPLGSHTVQIGVHLRWTTQDAQGLHHHLGTLDISDEGHRVVDGHTPGAVTLSHEGGRCPGTTIPHGQVDDQVKLVLR